MIVVGYGYGATLAFYVAANSARWGLPIPKAVVSIFPRRGPFAGVELAPLARSTRVVLQVGDADTASAKSAANALWRAIERHPVTRGSGSPRCTAAAVSAPTTERPCATRALP